MGFLRSTLAYNNLLLQQPNLTAAAF